MPLHKASGRITPDRAGGRRRGVELISSRWITHSAPIVDLGLEID